MSKFQKGYKQFKVLEAINAKGSASYTEIIEFAYNLSYGEGSFNSVKNRGYWSGIFQKKTDGWGGADVNGWATRLLIKKNKAYSLNVEGINKLHDLRHKFGEAPGTLDRISKLYNNFAKKSLVLSEKKKDSPELPIFFHKHKKT